eukprot:365187-Chlamydomonas_euryale.AAC.14
MLLRALPAAVLSREHGNDAFSRGRFDEAANLYSRALQLAIMSPEADRSVLSTLYSNRSAAFARCGWAAAEAAFARCGWAAEEAAFARCGWAAAEAAAQKPGDPGSHHRPQRQQKS